MAMDPSMMEYAPADSQGNNDTPDTLQKQVVSRLKENLSIPYNHPISVRQAPINGDDHDSWETSDKADAFDHLANELIELIQGNNDSEAPSADEED